MHHGFNGKLIKFNKSSIALAHFTGACDPPGFHFLESEDQIWVD